MSDAVDRFERRPVRLTQAAVAVDWGIAVEAPVEIRLNGRPWTVMLATPAELDDLAVGLALSEGLIGDASAIARIDASAWLGEFAIDLAVPTGLLRDPWSAPRALAGNSGCGLCGIESLAALRARRAPAADHGGGEGTIADEAIQAAFAALPAWQPVNEATRSVHAAAWCRPDGSVALVREDVGRHNALDKVVGALGRSGRIGEAGFVVMTSRCSYELVAKAVTAGAQLLATISAPTTLALTWAHHAGLPLACLGPGRRVARFPEEVAHAGG